MSTAPIPPKPGLPAPAQAAALWAVLVDLLIAMAHALADSGPLGRLLAAYLQRTAHQLATPLTPRATKPRCVLERAEPPAPPAPLSWRARFRRWKSRLNPLAGLRQRRAPMRALRASIGRARAPRAWPKSPPPRRPGTTPNTPHFSKPLWSTQPHHAHFVAFTYL